MIGIYVPDFSGTFYGQILQTVEGELRGVDRHMVAANGCGHVDARQQALDGIRFLNERECVGVLVMSNDLSDDDFEMLFDRYPTLVLLNRVTIVRPTHCFSSDHELGGRLAARALIEKGHREIACIGGPHTAPDNKERIAGFLDELAQHRVRVPKRRRIDADFSFDGGYAATEKLLARAPLDFSALFCANDVMAMAAISCLDSLGIDVPGHLSVIGFDDSELARYTAPKLTTVHVPIADAAAAACRFLLNLCYDLELSVGVDFAPRIAWRDSVADISARSQAASGSAARSRPRA
jgi:LacI family transcriptional regulator